MGAHTAQVQPAPQSQSSGKGAPAPAVMPDNDFKPVPIGQSDGIQRPMGKGGAITTPVQSGQPSIGRPNTYANTVGPWDNSTNSTQMPFKGKGKGA